MTEKTRLMTMAAAIPWIYPILFGYQFWEIGYLTPVLITTFGASFLCAMLGRDIADRAQILAPANDANTSTQPGTQVRTQQHQPPPDLARLRAWQADPNVHPFTCGSGRRTDEYHLDGEGILTPTATGWTCPYCDYRQPYGDLERSI